MSYCCLIINLILFLNILFIHNVDGRFYHNTIKIFFGWRQAHSEPLMLRGFGFLTGGFVDFRMHCPIDHDVEGSPSLFLLFCSTADSRQLMRMDTAQLNFDCLQIGDLGRTDAFCRRMHIKGNVTDYLFSQYIEVDYFYHFILLQCPQKQDKMQDMDVREISTASNKTRTTVAHCQSYLTLLNPGNEHLSSDEIPMPLMYYVFMFVWVLILAVWSVNFIIYYQYSNKLHKLLSIAPIGKTLLIIVILLKWRRISESGVASTPEMSLHYLLESVCDSYLFILMIIIAEGYCIVQAYLKHFKWTSVALIFFIFMSSLLCVQWVHSYFLAFSVCCVVFMMYKTLKWCSYNIEFLYRRRRKATHFIQRCNLRYASPPHQPPVTISAQLTHKLDMFTKFRVLCAAFSMIYAIVVTLATFLTEYTYVRALTYELPQIICYTAAGFIFRLRNFHKFENIEIVVPKENCVVIFLPTVCERHLDPNIMLGIPLSSPQAAGASGAGGAAASDSAASGTSGAAASGEGRRRRLMAAPHHRAR